MIFRIPRVIERTRSSLEWLPGTAFISSFFYHFFFVFYLISPVAELPLAQCSRYASVVGRTMWYFFADAVRDAYNSAWGLAYGFTAA